MAFGEQYDLHNTLQSSDIPSGASVLSARRSGEGELVGHLKTTATLPPLPSLVHFPVIRCLLIFLSLNVGEGVSFPLTSINGDVVINALHPVRTLRLHCF